MTPPDPLHETLYELLDRSRFASRRGDWAKALEYADRALEIDGEHHLGHRHRGLALWNSGERMAGLRATLRSVELRPDFASAHYDLACFYAHLERRDEMLAALRRAIELNSDYMDRARRDADFEEYEDDDDFLALTRPDGPAARDLQRVFEGDDLAAISDKLRKLGTEIPLAAIGWVNEGDGADLNGVLKRQAERLETPVLRAVYRVIATRVYGEIHDLEGWDELHRVLRGRDDHDFAALLRECWRERYENIDPGHLGPLERTMLQHLGGLAADVKARLILDALRSHGPDALGDLRGLCASALAGLGEDEPLTRKLVDAVDRVMHGALYADADHATRRRRVILGLPPPPIELPQGTEDRWAWQRAALESVHPLHVLSGARQLSIQTDPEARSILEPHLPRLSEFACDEELPDDARVTAIETLDKGASTETLEGISPALNSPSPAILFAAGRVLREHGIPFEADGPARALEARMEAAQDWTEEHDVVKALRWFVTPRTTQILLDASSHEVEAVRREALEGLGFHAPEAAIDVLAAQLLDGSGQCVAAAAKALARYESPRAREVMRDAERYRRVWSRAKREPRWIAAALPCFDVPSLSNDLFELFFSIKEYEALEPLAAGLRAHPRETLLVDLVTTGLDAYRLNGRPGRYFVEIARAAVAARPDGPSDGVREALVAVLSRADASAVEELAAHADGDVKYATERAADPALARRQRRAYANRLEGALTPLGDAIAVLPWSLIGVRRDEQA